MVDRLQITKNWLPRYTSMSLDNFGDYILLTNFRHYVDKFAEMFSCDIQGESRPMQAATNSSGLTIINFGIGSANAATIMDLLSAIQPKGVLFLGKCGGLKKSSIFCIKLSCESNSLLCFDAFDTDNVPFFFSSCLQGGIV